MRSYRRLGPVSVVDSDGNETRLPQDPGADSSLLASHIVQDARRSQAH
jgi:hypothetical protein